MSNLPKDWELKTLGELVSILTDYTANGSFASLKENVTYFNEPNFAALVRTTDLKKKEFKPERFTDKRGYEFLKKSALYGGEILMANVGSIGEVYIVPEVDFPMTLAPNMYLIKYNDNLINTYAYYFMNSSIFINQLLSKIASTTLQAVNKANFKSIKIPLPPLEEQKKIADILSTVDKKIAFVEENINATEELKKGLMQKLLTEGIGHTEFKNSELGRIPESWEIDKLENLTTKIGDGLHGTPKYVEQSDYYFINGNNLNGESIEINKNTKCVNEEEYIKNKKILDNTTILLSINGTIGSLAYYNNENVMLGKSVAYMNVNSKILKQFLFYLLKSSKILEYFILELTGTTIKNLSLKTIRNTKIPLPPLEEQKQIAEILSTVDNKLENLKEKKQSFEELKKGLMQKLLTGEVRV
ncbi:restriction endonuclease subunit S [Aliarcobacter cryaerophilus]|uniref:restriction endonuclease subunit S n=1 Tax=Aliarcobacter cryaerophilus TaxID=28198 RepID=UPI003DA60EC2